MKILKSVGALVGLLLLGACTTHYIDDQLGPIEQDPGQGSAFAKALHKEYIGLARTFQQNNFLSEALFWGNKSARAGTGEEVAWENVDKQGLPPDQLAEAKKNEARLNAVIAAGAKTSDPADLAIAQVSFDCMIRDWCMPIFKNILPGCRQRFEDAMAKLEKKPMAEPAAHDFIIFFDFDKYNIRADAARILDTVVTAVKGMGSPKMMLIGNTDTVGTKAYNQTLSEQRAASAKAYLVQHGIPAANISTIGKSFTNLRVPTPMNVREQENRNVQIQIK
ncbi:MAG TPA: OmpA family protein [Alphaproteobacteria bacterium]|jgi:outer membrane protein OmpA-like peptidoglycan-associated protein|nr:OmpA family protein [Alphaproteobacteria bacterium]